MVYVCPYRSEELYNFLISLRQQCCYLTETVQDVISRFPRRASELVLSLDPKKEAQAICNELVAQTGDLQKEVACLKNLLHKVHLTPFSLTAVYVSLSPKSPRHYVSAPLSGPL
ncbi:unnamed protein product [Oncorhynchus mykiss]|uniref:Uncharacterized protein n=1 Tax=Oncorhynchus mykiss TaxID=8022 RepID=A0A060YZV2_ONCMY|nr:unnamed protein product [Oncorhynchus mykiss]